MGGVIQVIGPDRDCCECGLCKTRSRIVWGRGAPNAPFAFYGEAPGFYENRKGRPWIGTAGTETRHLLVSNGINPHTDVFWSNMVKCWPGEHNPDPTWDQISTCLHHVLLELETINPSIIISMGRFATEFFLGQQLPMERVNGIPFYTDYGIVVPIYHTAWGLRNPDDMVKVQYGFGALKAVYEGKLEPRILEEKPVEGRYWEAKGRDSGYGDILCGVPDTIAIDTEWAAGGPFCLTLTSTPHQAIMIKTESTNPLQSLNSYANNVSTCKEIIIHNAPYDLPVLAKMGIRIPTSKLRDSMVAAYLLQSEPQGLKDLGWRHLGVDMEDYPDVVRPYRFDKAVKYLSGITEYEWPDPEPILEWKKGEDNEPAPHVRQPQNITRLVSNILRDVEDPGKNVDPYMRWDKIRKDKGRSDIPLIEHNCGILYDGDLSDVPPDIALQYACTDSDVTFQIWPYLRDRIIAEGMWDVFMVDMSMMPMVADMMRFGIKVDTTKFDELRDVFDQELFRILNYITNTCGYSINPNSPIQVSELLYGKLGLGDLVDKSMSKGKSDLLTDDAILSRLEPHHPTVKWIREYRKYLKLKSSYVDKLPRMVDPDGRIRATVRITRVATGRLSCSDPPLMAIPTRTEAGRRIREAFVAEDWCEIGCADYSQVEMRVAADQSQDPRMCRIFEKDEDIHNKTASEMFGIAESRLDEMKHRYPAKRVGFGVLNDISAYGLQRELIVGGAEEGDWPLDRCQELIDTWFDVYPGVRAYMDRNRAYAAKHGKIIDMWGRVRWIPWAQVKTRWKKEEGLKQAGNTPIQSGAQGVIKRAMTKVQPMFEYYRRVIKKRVVPLMQIHDDLMNEYDKKIIMEVMKKQKVMMEEAAKEKMRIPLKVDMKKGPSWGEAKKFKF